MKEDPTNMLMSDPRHRRVMADPRTPPRYRYDRRLATRAAREATAASAEAPSLT